MPKKLRDLIFIIFIILFTIGTIVISIYASGYKFNLSWPLKLNRLLIKTGMIAVDTLPSGATIYLDDQPQSNFSLNPLANDYLTSAAKIKNVLPGEYTLTLKLDGYWPISKKITVYSNQTTFAEDINLFRSDQPLLIASSSKEEFKLNADFKYLFLPSAKKIITLKNGQEKIIKTNDNSGCWLANEDKLLASGWLFNPDGINDVNYAQIIGSNAYNWQTDENNNRLYYQGNGSLNYLDIGSQKSTSVLTNANCLAYEARGNSLFFIEEIKGQTTLKKYSLNAQKNEQELILPSVGKYRFINDDSKFISLYDDKNRTLYLINPEQINANVKILKNIKSWQWLNDHELFYNNDLEIYRFDLNNNDNTLLTRLSEEISKINWNKSNNYLIFATANNLNAFDLKIGIITKIFQAEEIAYPVLNNQDDIVYFWAKINNQSGVYSLQLQ